MKERYNFTTEFQELILACIIKHPDNFIFVNNVLKPSYFTSIIAQSTARTILEYIENNGFAPSLPVIIENTLKNSRKIGSSQEKDDIVTYIKKLDDTPTSDYKYVSETVINFAKERAYLNTAKEIVEAIRDGNDVGDVVKKFDDISQLGNTVDDLGLVLHRDIDVIVKRLKETYAGILSGFPAFDVNWRNGWAPGWLVVPLAPPKSFKSTLCLNLARNFANAGHDVIYYACEINEALAGLRMLQAYSQKTDRDFYSNTEDFVLAARSGLRKEIRGNVILKEFPAKGATIKDLESHSRTVIAQYGIKPRAIFIDYAETIKPTKSLGSDYREQASIYTDARAMGKKLNATIIMPDRCNAETVERAVPNMKSFQGSFEKAGIVDVAFGICGKPEEIVSGYVRYFIFLNRHGPQYKHFEGGLDVGTMSMTIDKEIPYNPEDSEKQNYSARGKSKSKQDMPSNLADLEDE